ncbi:hypothetical protein IFR05_005320 [Cadophora sp. M221]|nr:hypothetical protein IFR05_005320 [Cadophora sp. M221]
MTRLPRRHAQRKALNRGRTKTHLFQQTPQACPQIAMAKCRAKSFPFDDEDEKDSSSSSDSDSERNHDSGYSSDSVIEQAEYYQRLQGSFREAGPTMAILEESARRGMETEGKKWNEFCEKTTSTNPERRDPVAALIAAGSTPRSQDPAQPNSPEVMDTSTFKTYLTWRRDQGPRIKRQGTIATYWHSLSMYYQRTAKDYLHGSILLDMKNWIPELGLDNSDKEKASLHVVDLYTLQNGLWVRDKGIFPHERLRVQESPLNIFSLCTSTRPAALVGISPLLYEALEFQVFPPPVLGHPSLVVLVLNLTNIKRSGGKKRPKKFTFYEGENMICCPVLFVLSLALADKAFKNKFTSLAQIHSLIVPPTTDRIRLKWDDDWKQRPIFRDVEPKPKVVRVSQHDDLKQLPPCRDVETRSKGVQALTPEERRHVMGNRGDVYERYYMSTFIDADYQAINLGTTRREDLIRHVGRLERHEGAPCELNDEQKLEISNNPEVVALIESREKHAREIKMLGYRTNKAAEGTLCHERYTTAQRKLNSLKNKLRDVLLERAINNFHETVHVAEVDRQMLGILPDEVLTPSYIEYELEERATAARLLFQPVEDLDVFQFANLRVQLVQALTQLCHRQESPLSEGTSGLSTLQGWLPLKGFTALIKAVQRS